MKNSNHHVLRPASFRLDGGAMYGIIPRPLWEKKSPPDELNRIDLALRLVLIKSGDKNILIDTGIGDYRPEKWNNRFDVRSESEPLKVTLKKDFGLSPSEITDVILSHLHFDHVGGLGSDEQTLLFPSATIHLHRKHYDYAQNPTPRDSGSFEIKAINQWIDQYIQRGQVNWLHEEKGEILEGIHYLCSHGHTPHMIHPYNDEWIYMADLVPTSHHVSIPWVMGYDINPGVTATEKKHILEFIVENNLICIFEHDPEFWGASLKRSEKGIQLDKTFKCKSREVNHSA